MTTAVHSFDLPVSTDLLTKTVYPLPVVYVAYKLWYNGKITDIHYNMPLGFGGMVKDWVLFDEHVKAACESNKENYRLHGDWMSRASPEMSPLEFHELYQQQLHG